MARSRRRPRPGSGRRRRLVVEIMLALAALLVVGVFSLVRPARVVLPAGMLGLRCAGTVCTDDPTRLDEARTLYEGAVASTTVQLGPAPAIRRVVFCTTDRCYRRFGWSRSTATTIADAGIVVSPTGWKDYYVRHELVHHWQAVRLGLVARYRDPRWLIEGMAYDLSGDPRPLLVEPNQAYRATFVAWYLLVGPENVWTAARQVKP